MDNSARESKTGSYRQSQIENKIRIARYLYSQKDKILDDKIEKLLSQLDQAIDESRKIMEGVGVTKACRECGDVSCCGKGIEEKYEVTTLLINLLLGVEIQKGDAEGCYFLTKSGCSLKVREVLCVNYLCDKIRRSLSHDDLVAVQETCGKELDILFSLSELIKRKIRENLDYNGL
ncbi:MAG: hypothetical protein H0Z28_01855 [Archaeoglobus sp.]|nr:hypothetical protein [Archaeoglobus sp.]